MKLPAFNRESLARLIVLEKINLVEVNIDSSITVYTDHLLPYSKEAFQTRAS